MRATIKEWPNISNKEMATILRPYISDIFITDVLLQKTRKYIRTIVFGDPNKNVQLMGSLADKMESLGHYFEVKTKTPREVIQKLEEIVLSEHMKKVKKDGKKMKRDDKIKYVKDWKEKNYEMLLKEGLVEGTLYSCYGITANCNASPVAFGIVFGNEDKSGWVNFWMFAKKIHPALNTLETTIITDREKGSIEAMEEVLPLAVNFFVPSTGRKILQHLLKEDRGNICAIGFISNC
jgi:hypothetical protein